jgi:uncharacterized membrane protein
MPRSTRSARRANGHVPILTRMIDVLAELAEIAVADQQRNALARHGAMVRRACRRSIPEPDDQADAERELRRLDAALAGRVEPHHARP